MLAAGNSAIPGCDRVRPCDRCEGCQAHSLCMTHIWPLVRFLQIRWVVTLRTEVGSTGSAESWRGFCHHNPGAGVAFREQTKLGRFQIDSAKFLNLLRTQAPLSTAANFPREWAF